MTKRFLLTIPSIALRNLLRQPRRSAMAVSAVSFGVMALMLATGFIQWIYFDLRESTIRAHLGHLQVARPGYHDAGRSDPYKYLLPPGGPALTLIEHAPAVETVAPRLYFSGLASHGETTISFTGEGVDPTRESQLSRSLVIESGAGLHAGDDRGALFGAGLAANLGVTVGDQIVLLVNTPAGGINAVEVVVRGLFSTVSKALDDTALRLPIETARRLLRVQGSHEWLVLLSDTDRTDAATAALRRQLRAQDFEITPWYVRADFYNKTVALFSRQLTVIRFIIAAIIVLSISNTMILGVLERTGEIGTSMALGATRKRILGQFIVEGAALGVFGGALGIAGSLVLASVISAIGIPMPAPPGMAHGYVGQIRLTASLALGAFELATITALLASLYPAWNASRLVIVDALRTNR